MKKNEVLVAIGTPHRKREPGKQSPDRKLKECVYGREIASEVAAKLQAMGYKCVIDYMPLDLPKQMQSQSAKLERQRERQAEQKRIAAEKAALNEEIAVLSDGIAVNLQKKELLDGEIGLLEDEIDAILDKIRKSGYDSLTSEEKRKLFEQSKK